MFRENTVYMADFIPTKKKLGGEQHSTHKSAMSVFIKLFCIMYKQLVIIFFDTRVLTELQLNTRG